MINLLGLTTTGRVNSPFGYRGDIGVDGATSYHKGIDITLSNDNIPAVLGSTVLDKGTDSSRGNWIKVRQSDGTTATYMHLAKLPSWSVGAYIMEGATVGIQGNTGISSGKHLHYELFGSDGNYIDPEQYFTSGTNGEYSSLYYAEPLDDSEGIGFWGNLIKFLAYLLLAVLAVVLFLFAFDIKIF